VVQRYINKEMSTLSVAFPLFCPTPILHQFDIRVSYTWTADIYSTPQECVCPFLLVRIHLL
jgi:hypothetical protein